MQYYDSIYEGFRVWSEGGKPRYYNKLSEATQDFTRADLAGASISLMINSTAICYLNAPRIAEELAGGVV